MSKSSCFLVCLGDSGLTYLSGNRAFNFYVEPHGDHVHVDMSVHVVEPSLALGGGRYLAAAKCPHFGTCRFRLPLPGAEFDGGDLMYFISSDEFQAFACRPLDDLAGNINPKKFGMMAD